MKKSSRIWTTVLFTAILIGFIDGSYLTYKHFFQPLSSCGVGLFGDCGTVLQSSYSIMFGIPLAVWGMLQYLSVGFFMVLSEVTGARLYKRLLFIQTAIGVVFSLYFTFLQLGVIGALCQFCLISAGISTGIYVLARYVYIEDYHSFLLEKMEVVYKLFFKPFLFLLSAEWVHDQAMFWGEQIGRVAVARQLIARVLSYKHDALKTTVNGVFFANPIGLSAGYDYVAAFPLILPSIGFGFETIGTISHKSFAGNSKPRLGRLPKSQSLLVNKGFRNPGATAIIKKISKTTFSFPVGISIGRTNNAETHSLEKAIVDIVSAFKKFENSTVRSSYYELNISCPNLKGALSFYPPQNLRQVLKAVARLDIQKPLFIKMPIEKSDKEVTAMLKVIASFEFVTGVIFGNLQKDRSDASFDPDEIASAGKGNFSGKPTFRRSNELIRLAYQLHGARFVIIGCGGVFTAEDAYRKIRSGATLIQMITGMIFEGPQRISQINRGLVQYLKQDGYSHISDAVGVDA